MSERKAREFLATSIQYKVDPYETETRQTFNPPIKVREVLPGDEVEELKKRVEKLEWQLRQFVPHVTTNCLNARACGGRITLFQHSNRCISCAPEDYEHYETKIQKLKEDKK